MGYQKDARYTAVSCPERGPRDSVLLIIKGTIDNCRVVGPTL